MVRSPRNCQDEVLLGALGVHIRKILFELQGRDEGILTRRVSQQTNRHRRQFGAEDEGEPDHDRGIRHDEFLQVHAVYFDADREGPVGRVVEGGVVVSAVQKKPAHEIRDIRLHLHLVTELLDTLVRKVSERRQLARHACLVGRDCGHTSGVDHVLL